MDKKTCRQVYLHKREQLDAALCVERSRQIAKHLVDYLEQLKPSQIFAYASHRGEPDILTPILSEAKWPVALPVVGPAAGEMHFYECKAKADLAPNRYGIMEPKDRSQPVKPSGDALVLVPCVAVDKYGCRLGYGGGYYDRFLPRMPVSRRIGVVFSDFMVEGPLPREAHDQQLHGVLTELGWTWFSEGD